MKVSDVRHVKVEWMEGFSNDPGLNFILKRGADIAPNESYRWNQTGSLYWAELDGQFKYLAQSHRDHEGFGGSIYTLAMSPEWAPESREWGMLDQDAEGWMVRRCGCKYHPDRRSVMLRGPWHCGASRVSREVRPILDVGILTNEYNNRLRIPRYYQRMQRQGRAWDGTYLNCGVTLEFCQAVIDVHAPHLELYEGDYGWYPVRKGDDPKNPRKGRAYSRFTAELSDEQARMVEW